MLVFMFILVFVIGVMVIIVGQIVADRTACRAPQSRTDKTTRGTTDAIANHLATRRAKSSANG